LWNRRYIDNIQITGAESIGVEGRGAYYQEAGWGRARRSRPTRYGTSERNCCVRSGL
jgi:hypothetical protein